MDEMKFKKPYGNLNKLLRMLWRIVWTIFAKPFPRNSARKWKIYLLRVFGAKVHSTCSVYSSVDILMPWNLIMEEYSCIANKVILENSDKVLIGKYSIVSQYSYLCTASHDIRKINFPQFTKPITIGKRCWIAANCFIGPGVQIGDGGVIGASSSVFKNVNAWTVVGGSPAKLIGTRDVIENDEE